MRVQRAMSAALSMCDMIPAQIRSGKTSNASSSTATWRDDHEKKVDFVPVMSRSISNDFFVDIPICIYLYRSICVYLLTICKSLSLSLALSFARSLSRSLSSIALLTVPLHFCIHTLFSLSFSLSLFLFRRGNAPHTNIITVKSVPKIEHTRLK